MSGVSTSHTRPVFRDLGLAPRKSRAIPSSSTQRTLRGTNLAVGLPADGDPERGDGDVQWDEIADHFRNFVRGGNHTEKTTSSYVYTARYFWRELEEAEVDPALASKFQVRAWFTRRAARVSQ